MNFLLLLLHRSIQTVKLSLKSLNICKFTAWCPDVLADKLHPRFEQKGAAYTPVFTVHIFTKIVNTKRSKICPLWSNILSYAHAGMKNCCQSNIDRYVHQKRLIKSDLLVYLKVIAISCCHSCALTILIC